MADLTKHTTVIQVLFETDTDYGRYSDAICLSAEEFSAISDEELETQKNERISTFVSRMQESSTREYVITEEELVAQKEELMAQIEEVDTKLQQVSRADTSLKKAK